MDIDILLALQQFRNGIGGCLAEFMTKMTFFGELSTTPVLLAIVYWCINKEFGSFSPFPAYCVGNHCVLDCIQPDLSGRSYPAGHSGGYDSRIGNDVGDFQAYAVD